MLWPKLTYPPLPVRKKYPFSRLPFLRPSFFDFSELFDMTDLG